MSRSRWRVTKSALELWQYRFLLDAKSAPTAPQLARSSGAAPQQPEAGLGELLAWLPIAEELGLVRVGSPQCKQDALSQKQLTIEARAQSPIELH